MSGLWRLRVAAFIATVAAIVVAVPAQPAFAHNALRSSDPADGTSLATSPTSLSMTFRETPNAALAQVAVVDAAGVSLTVGAPAGAGTTLTQALRAVSAAGPVTVTYRVVSTDGHPVQGKLGFTVTAAPASTSSPVPPSSPATATAVPASSSPPASTAATTKASSSGPSAIALVGGLVAGLVVVGVAVAFLPRRRKP